MKKAQIKEAVETHLTAIGFRRGQWEWQPLQAQLIVVIGDAIKTVKLKSGISRRALTYKLGRIAGWAEMAGLPAKPNGIQAPLSAAVSTGMPA